MRKRLSVIVAIAAMIVTMIPAMSFADNNSPVVAKVGNAEYTDLQEAIKAAAPNGTVEIISDVTIDKWVMFAETLSIGNGNIITLNINGLTINGNDHSLTVNSIESAGNGNRLFYDAQNLNINDLTINIASEAGNVGGIGLQSGVLNNITFNGGGYGVLPGNGEITIKDCTFKTNNTAVYYEEARDNLAVTGCTFDLADTTNVILLRGNTVFKDNTINSGRTVNVVSGSPVVSGNIFAEDVRFKVYNDATAIITDNILPYVTFDEENEPANSTFKGNTLSEDAEAALEAAGCVNAPKDPTSDESDKPEAPIPEDKPAASNPEESPETGDNMNMAIPFAISGLALAAMATVVTTRRRQN